MSQLFQETFPLIRITIVGTEKYSPSLQEFWSFFYDFNMVYERLRLALDEKYTGHAFTASSYRAGRLVQRSDQLLVERIHLGSPLEAQLILTMTGMAVTTVYVAFQAIEKAYTTRANRRKTEAETRKLHAEAEKIELENFENLRRLALETSQSEESMARQLASPKIKNVIRQAVHRLQDSPLRLSSAKVEIVPPGEHVQKENS
jgi:hypothetical protein